MKFKRVFLLIPFLSSLFLLTNCNRLPNKVNTLFGINDVSKRTMQHLSKNELEGFMDNDELRTFILVQTTKNCSCSLEFENIVNDYVKETGLLIYYSDYEEIKDTNYGFALRDNKPTFHVVLKGKNLGNLEKCDDEKFRTDPQTFKTFMDTHISKPSLFIIDETALRDLFTKDDNFMVYYAKSGCAECEYFENFILNDYAQTHLDDMKKMYYFDFKDKATTLKTDFGLTESFTWGYKSGALPVVHYIEPKDNHSTSNSTKQAYMFGNDILDESFKIKESYYTETRLNKISYPSIESPINKQYQESDTKKDGEYTVLNNIRSDELYRQLAFNFFEHFKDSLA